MFAKQKTIPYVFFDIDGVLNCEKDWHQQHFTINQNCFAVFKEFLEYVHKQAGIPPKLIICSTWRAGFDNKDRENADAGSLLETVFQEADLFISGATPVSNKTRQEEIEYYIRRNNVEQYLIIDDDTSLYNDKTKINLYVPDYKTGLTAKDLKNLKKLWK